LSRRSRRALLAIVLASLLAPLARAGTVRRFTVEVEEPTGLERRDGEVTLVTASFAPGQAREGGLVVLDAGDREVPVQVETRRRHPDGSLAEAVLLFPVTMIPGERPRFTLLAGGVPAPVGAGGSGGFANEIVARRLGTSRLEIGNSRFTLVLSLGRDGTVPAIVEAYNRSAAAPRMLNLVETTPDVREPLPLGEKSAGWSTGARDAERLAELAVDVVEAGPLRGRVVLRGSRGALVERWELEWTAGSEVLLWRATSPSPAGRFGFVLSSLSAAPYEPFTHWAHGSEYEWPSGWTTDEPPHHPVAVATKGPLDPVGEAMADLPGGLLLYYRHGEDYGALALLETDARLAWTGVGARQVTATLDQPASASADETTTVSIALAFPRFRGTETVLEARAAARRFRHPLLAHVLGPAEPLVQAPRYEPAPRTAAFTESRAAATARGGERPPLGRGASDFGATLSLDGEWRLEGFEKGEGQSRRVFDPAFDDSSWRTVRVPGTVHVQVLAPGEWFRPEAAWVSRKEWWYRRSFRAPEGWGEARTFLAFAATDYHADVWLNGEWIGRHEGYVDPWEIELRDRLRRDGDNVLVVRVWTPVHYYWKHRPYTVKGSYGAVDQKPDDVTAVGITGPVALRASGPVRIEDLLVRPQLDPDGSADVEVTVRLDRAPPEEAQVELLLEPRTFEGGERARAEAVLRRGHAPDGRTASYRFRLAKPRLWWTWDHGRPDLYTLQARVLVAGRVSDQRRQAVGLRTIEKVGWVFYLNGRRLFVRGTNAYYLELFLSEMTREKYERDLRLVRGMNVNMLRLHCHFANRPLYELADEIGILVWQDFLEAWYPHDRAFAQRAASLYDPLVRMVREHPSIALWAASDEEDLENYRVLTKHLAPRPFDLDPERRPVHRSTGRYGDAHVYEGWYGGTIWDYTRTEERFISELGATALPSVESLRRFLPDAWPIANHRERWVFHKLQVAEAMAAWGSPEGQTLEEYVPRTQAYVALLHQLAIERMRRRKYDAGGILHFHAIDFWPSVTMAAVDYYRVPTRSYAAVRRAFQMVLPSLAFDRDRWAHGEVVRCGLWVVNDHWHALPGSTVRWRFVDARGRTLARGQRRVDVPADSSRQLEDLSFVPPRPGAYELLAEVVGRDGRLVSDNGYHFEVE
jgi:beta-mannosidase